MKTTLKLSLVVGSIFIASLQSVHAMNQYVWTNESAANRLGIAQDATNSKILEAYKERMKEASEKMGSQDNLSREAAGFLIGKNQTRNLAIAKHKYKVDEKVETYGNIHVVRQTEYIDGALFNQRTIRQIVENAVNNPKPHNRFYNKKTIGLAAMGIGSVLGITSYIYRNEFAGWFKLCTSPLFNYFMIKIRS